MKHLKVEKIIIQKYNYFIMEQLHANISYMPLQHKSYN